MGLRQSINIFRFFCFILFVGIAIACFSNYIPRKNYATHVLMQDSIEKLEIKHKFWNVVHDTKNVDIKDFFNKSKCVYCISYPHEFDSIYLPKYCEIYFNGGSLKGKIKFDNNYLSGNVNIKKSDIYGSICNEQFDLGWICNGDGVHDDAKYINEALSVCPNVHFRKGTYLLESYHIPYEKLEPSLHKSVQSHIGIYKSGVTLIGDDGATIFVKDKSKTISIYTIPNHIEESIKNIRIENINFKVFNDTNEFNEFSHTIKIIGVNGLMIKDCRFLDFSGDAICLSHYGDDEITGERTRNSDVTISNNYIEGHSHNNRNGISVINGENILIDHNTIEEISKTNMPGAIDIEPNNSVYTINKICISNNKIVGCRGKSAILIVLQNKSSAHNIKIENNKIENCNVGLAFSIKPLTKSRNFQVINNTIDNNTIPYYFGGKGASKNWIIKENNFQRETKAKLGGSINIENLIVD